jgi:tRNA (guanine-N7-)-methyltransferase
VRNRFRFDPAEVRVETAAPLPEALGPDDRDLHVEIGFGKDVRTLREAEANPDALFLGVEISRKKVVKFCQKVARAGLRNVRAYLGDARHVLRELLPAGSVASFTILFPDPWPKRRHHKHRWIQDDTAALLAAALRDGGRVIVATDHDGYAAQIERCLAGTGLELEEKREGVPEEDRSLFAQRFERLGESVTWMRWRKP